MARRVHEQLGELSGAGFQDGHDHPGKGVASAPIGDTALTPVLWSLVSEGRHQPYSQQEDPDSEDTPTGTARAWLPRPPTNVEQ